MDKSLYERLGGSAGITKLVDDIIESHMRNPTIKARFLPYREKPEELATAKRNLCDFIAAGSGGPEQYGGRSMPEAHRGMNISTEEYMAAVDDIMSVLSEHDVEEGARNEVLAIAYSLKGEITRV